MPKANSRKKARQGKALAQLVKRMKTNRKTREHAHGSAKRKRQLKNDNQLARAEFGSYGFLSHYFLLFFFRLAESVRAAARSLANICSASRLSFSMYRKIKISGWVQKIVS